MQNQTGIIRAAIACIVIVVLAACGCTTSPSTNAPCITDKNARLTIRWGNEDDSLRTIEYYEVNQRGEVTKFVGTQRDSTTSKYLGWIPHDLYCERIASLRSAFLQTQAMNLRGVRARFMEYVNPSGDVFLRLVWNPDLQTFQSRFVRPEYDALMSHLRDLQ